MYKYKVAIRRSSQQHKASKFSVFWLIEYSYIRFKFMVTYGRFRKSRRVSRSRGGMRRASSARRRSGLKRVSRPRFATIGFTRNVEKKYFDRTYQANAGEVVSGQTAPALKNNGVTYISETWGDYSFSGQVATASVVSNDMLKGVVTGTTARTRIGNKLRVKYVKGSFTFTAAQVANAITVSQGGEGSVSTVLNDYGMYLRTSIRFVIVKDLQVNSTDTQITWSQVFDTTNLQAGIHSELNVDNMGRFVVLEDKSFTLDAETPQKNCAFNVSGNSLGSVRYNGPTGTALTDKGLYVVWAAFVMGYNNAADKVAMPSPVGHSRLCFIDG